MLSLLIQLPKEAKAEQQQKLFVDLIPRLPKNHDAIEREIRRIGKNDCSV